MASIITNRMNFIWPSISRPSRVQTTPAVSSTKEVRGEKQVGPEHADHQHEQGPTITSQMPFQLGCTGVLSKMARLSQIRNRTKKGIRTPWE